MLIFVLPSLFPHLYFQKVINTNSKTYRLIFFRVNTYKWGLALEKHTPMVNIKVLIARCVHLWLVFIDSYSVLVQ